MELGKQRFVERHPFGFASLVWALMILVYLAAGTAASIMHLGNAAIGWIANPTLMLVGLVVVARLGWWRELGVTAPISSRVRLLFWLPALFATRALWGGVGGPVALSSLASFALLALLVGMVEELFFRGIILRAVLPAGRGWAVFMSVALFSVTHLLNVLGGRDPLATLVQIGYAAALGYLYAALWLRARSLWPLMLVHALNDFLVWGVESGVGVRGVSAMQELIVPAILAVAALVYGTMMLHTAPARTVPEPA
jgi:membrane protease YdiL (CAAX protease family)